MRSLKPSCAIALLLGLAATLVRADTASAPIKTQDAAAAAAAAAAGGGAKYAYTAGKDGEALCKALETTIANVTSLKINNTFAQYYPTGSNPSLELLTQLYPAGTIPKSVRVGPILESVGPDIDITKDFGYGKSGGAGARAANNGPLGGLPAFCRFGAYIITSPVTIALTEVWLPLADDPSIALAAINQTDYPTDSTPIELGPNGEFLKGPAYLLDGDYEQVISEDPEDSLVDTPSTRATKGVPPPGFFSTGDKKDEKRTGAITESTRESEKPLNSKGSGSTTQITAQNEGSPTIITTSTSADDDASGSRKKQQQQLQQQINSRSSSMIPRRESEACNRDRRSIEAAKCSEKNKFGGNVSSSKKHRGEPLTGEELLGCSDGWNGRMLFIGNGGQRGFVPLTDLKQQMSRHRFAVVGTNTGHFSTAGGCNWVNGTQYDDTLLDFGSRSTHVSKILAEEVIDAFYGPESGVRVQQEKNSSKNHAGRIRAYAAGASVGGGRVLASAQVYPEDFDGILTLSPAIYFSDMNRGQIHTQSRHRKKTAKDGWFSVRKLAGPVKEVILDQCDKLDGVEDGVIELAKECKPVFEKDLLCGAPGAKFGGDIKTCLNQTQIDNLYELYRPTLVEEKFVYDRYLPGIEQRANSLTGAAKKAVDWTQLAILKFPHLDPCWDGYGVGINATGSDYTFAVVEKGRREDPGGVNNDDPDLSRFLKAGKKMIHTHGLADITISPLASERYYQQVLKTVGSKGIVAQDGYLYFEVAGMSHVRDGRGPWHYGQITANDAGNRPLKWDSEYDILLSLVKWVETGDAPKYQIGAAYHQRGRIIPPSNDDLNRSSSSEPTCEKKTDSAGALTALPTDKQTTAADGGGGGTASTRRALDALLRRQTATLASTPSTSQSSEKKTKEETLDAGNGDEKTTERTADTGAGDTKPSDDGQITKSTTNANGGERPSGKEKVSDPSLGGAGSEKPEGNGKTTDAGTSGAAAGSDKPAESTSDATPATGDKKEKKLKNPYTDTMLLPTVFASYEYGVLFTRPLCPYPGRVVYNGGPTNGKDAYKSFSCKLP
ncbi:tannase-domain-containing protein [Ceraceosorus guamensis]|uniref:Carboxylic ester hydrolase n=1 Tax=Ceraceosorus guamensis TaxID=1522189 RepID=A0A316VML0_9BASI|nr:tannase-domain-containing protein [Ceraceosorus guamensis]PWN38806.1 tannase-domain-containing protein [Ceraceosorus guamensis]